MTLPNVPKALGSLRHVFKSGLSAVRGESNPLGFRPVRKFLVVLVDGLGAEQIQAREGHSPFLAAAIKAGSVTVLFLQLQVPTSHH